MSLYEHSGPAGDGSLVPQLPVPKAPQACMSCRKQKRKCSKALPACALCERMNRHCDYSESAPAPTSEDFNALRMKLMELECRLNGAHANVMQTNPFPTPSGALISESGTQVGQVGQIPVYSPPRDVHWPGVLNRFPPIAFLDRDAFKNGGIPVPKPVFNIPPDVLDILGDGPRVQATITGYFATVHQWMPIVSQKRLTRDITNPLWEAGPDLALLFLCMNLIISRPSDGLDCSQSEVYLAVKRFMVFMESTGTMSLHVLQASIIITLYEYSHAVYPASWMSSGWSVRYGNLLGLNEVDDTKQLLGRPDTWTEQEERRRTWWGVLLVDRIISIGGMGYVLDSQEPKNDDPLPVDDVTWDSGEISGAHQLTVSANMDEPAAPFARLCQASVMMGKVMIHHKEKTLLETVRYESASQLYSSISLLARNITAEAANPEILFSIISPLALVYSSLCSLCDPYSCSTRPGSNGQSQMQTQAIDGLKTVAASIIDFAEQINTATPTPQELDRVSPIIMDAIYSGAATYAWMARESGDETYQAGLESLRQILRKLGGRWRNAAEYLRILEAQEFAYALTQNTT